MKQIVMAGPRKSEIIDVPIPEITDDQLLVKVTYTGMCHSEWYPWSTAKPGEVFGHETVGVVAKCGKMSRSSKRAIASPASAAATANISSWNRIKPVTCRITSRMRTPSSNRSPACSPPP